MPFPQAAPSPGAALGAEGSQPGRCSVMGAQRLAQPLRSHRHHTLVQTAVPSAPSCVPSSAAWLFFARQAKPVKSGQMGTCRSQRLLLTALIPKGKS